MFGTHLFIHSVYLFDISYTWISENLDYGKIKDDVNVLCSHRAPTEL